jgi:hypothetical protein
VLALLLASLLLLVRGIRTDRSRLLLWSFLLALPCPMLYEGAYPLLILHAAVAFWYLRGWKALRVAAPFLALAAVFVLLSLYLRTTSTETVPGYEVGSSPWAALRTFLIQLVAPIPGSTLLFRGEYANFVLLGSSPTKAELLAGAWRGAAVFAAVAAAGAWVAKERGTRLPSAGALGLTAVLGVLLWTVSVTAVAAAPKYQLELVAGKGHLPTLIQTFGWAMVLVAGVLALVSVAGRRSRFAVASVILGAAALLGFGAAVNGYNNMRVVALEVPITKSRGLLEDAAGRGALADVPADTTVLFSPNDLQWYTGNFTQVPDSLQALLRDRTGKRFDTRPVSPTTRFDCASDSATPDCIAPVGPQATWVRVRTRPGGGSVIVAPMGPGPAAANGRVTRDLRVYVTADDGGVPDPPRLIGSLRSGRRWSSEGVSWRPVSSGGDWAIYAGEVSGGAPVASRLDDANARVDFTALPDSDGIVRIYGTKDLLP